MMSLTRNSLSFRQCTTLMFVIIFGLSLTSSAKTKSKIDAKFVEGVDARKLESRVLAIINQSGSTSKENLKKIVHAARDLGAQWKREKLKRNQLEATRKLITESLINIEKHEFIPASFMNKADSLREEYKHDSSLASKTISLAVDKLKTTVEKLARDTIKKRKQSGVEYEIEFVLKKRVPTLVKKKIFSSEVEREYETASYRQSFIGFLPESVSGEPLAGGNFPSYLSLSKDSLFAKNRFVLIIPTTEHDPNENSELSLEDMMKSHTTANVTQVLDMSKTIREDLNGTEGHLQYVFPINFFNRYKKYISSENTIVKMLGRSNRAFFPKDHLKWQGYIITALSEYKKVLEDAWVELGYGHELKLKPELQEEYLSLVKQYNKIVVEMGQADTDRGEKAFLSTDQISMLNHSEPTFTEYSPPNFQAALDYFINSLAEQLKEFSRNIEDYYLDPGIKLSTTPFGSLPENTEKLAALASQDGSTIYNEIFALDSVWQRDRLTLREELLSLYFSKGGEIVSEFLARLSGVVEGRDSFLKEKLDSKRNGVLKIFNSIPTAQDEDSEEDADSSYISQKEINSFRRILDDPRWYLEEGASEDYVSFEILKKSFPKSAEKLKGQFLFNSGAACLKFRQEYIAMVERLSDATIKLNKKYESHPSFEARAALLEVLKLYNQKLKNVFTRPFYYIYEHKGNWSSVPKGINTYFSLNSNKDEPKSFLEFWSASNNIDGKETTHREDLKIAEIPLFGPGDIIKFDISSLLDKDKIDWLYLSQKGEDELRGLVSYADEIRLVLTEHFSLARSPLQSSALLEHIARFEKLKSDYLTRLASLVAKSSARQENQPRFPLKVFSLQRLASQENLRWHENSILIDHKLSNPRQIIEILEKDKNSSRLAY